MLSKNTSKLTNLTYKTDKIEVKINSLIIISLLCYVESFFSLYLTFGIASTSGSTGLGAIVIWTYHIVAIIILVVISVILFVLESCFKFIFNHPISIKLSKKVYAFFVGGLILPILTIFFIPIISIGFDTKLNLVGIGKLFPYQASINKYLTSKNIGISKDEFNKSYNKQKPESIQEKSIPKEQVVFYTSQIEQDGIKKSMVIEPNKLRKEFQIPQKEPDIDNETNPISQFQLNQIAEIWQPPIIEDYKNTTIKIELSENGHILSRTIIKTSGNDKFDNSVLYALDSKSLILKGVDKGMHGLLFLAGPNQKEVFKDSRLIK